MRFAAAAFGLFLVLSDFSMGAVEEPKIVEKVTPLPIALNRDFEFRKTKLYFLSEKLPKQTQERRTASSVTGTLSGRPAPAQKPLTLQDVPITFERQYRLFGAVTLLDARQRCGDYSISFGAPNGRAISRCVWSIARRNCTSTSRHRRFHIVIYAALIRQNSRSSVMITLMTGE